MPISNSTWLLLPLPNHVHLAQVMQAEKDKTDSEAEHARRAQAFTKAEHEVSQLEKKLKKFIQKSRPYFEEKDAFNRALESQVCA